MSETIDRVQPDDRDPRPRPSRSDTKPDRIDRADRDAGRSEVDRGDPDHDRKDGGKNGGKPKRRWPLLILALVVLLAIIAGGVYWYMTRNQESTDDAYTDGDSIVIAPKISGYVTELDVNDNTLVKAGQLLFKIDPRDYIAARDQARANQQQAEENYRRQRAVDPRATTQTNVDQATAQLKSNTATVSSAQANVQIAALVQQAIQTAQDQVQQAQAQVAQAEANLLTAEINLTYTEVRAPQDGRVTKRNVDLGTFVQAGQQSFYIVTPQVWVTANFKENQLADMKPGQPVTMSIDAYPNLDLHGHVDSIQEGSGAQFSAFPAENATGNFVKIVRRVPVKIDIDSGLAPGQTLPLGISVDPTVTVR